MSMDEGFNQRESEDNEQHVGNDSSDGEDAYEKLVNLQQVKKFLIDSQAFNAFWQRFKLLVESSDREVPVAETGDANEALAIGTIPSLFAAFRAMALERVRHLADLTHEGFSTIMANIKIGGERMSL
jgi:hypothetical protein